MRFVTALIKMANHLSNLSNASVRTNSPMETAVWNKELMYMRECKIHVTGYEALHKEFENFEVVMKQYSPESKDVSVDEVVESCVKEIEGFERHANLEEVCKRIFLGSKKCMVTLNQFNSALLSQAASEQPEMTYRGHIPKLAYGSAWVDDRSAVFFFTKSEKAVVALRFAI